MDYRERIDELLKQEGPTALSKRLGISRQTLANWRKGKVSPSWESIQALGGTICFPEKLSQLEPEEAGRRTYRWVHKCQ